MSIIVVGNGCPLLLYHTNSSLTMCTNCATPHHCSCFNDSLRKAKKEQRDRAVKALTTGLQKRKIFYLPTRTDNMVSIRLADNSRVLLSLKSRIDDWNFVVYKYRPANSSKWQELRRDAFFAWLKPLTCASSPSVHSGDVMPFGMYKGKALSDVVVTDRRYCQWVLDTVVGHPHLKKTIASLL